MLLDAIVSVELEFGRTAVVVEAVAFRGCSRFAQLSLDDAKLEETAVVEMSWPMLRSLED